MNERKMALAQHHINCVVWISSPSFASLVPSQNLSTMINSWTEECQETTSIVDVLWKPRTHRERVLRGNYIRTLRRTLTQPLSRILIILQINTRRVKLGFSSSISNFTLEALKQNFFEYKASTQQQAYIQWNSRQPSMLVLLLHYPLTRNIVNMYSFLLKLKLETNKLNGHMNEDVLNIFWSDFSRTILFVKRKLDSICK